MKCQRRQAIGFTAMVVSGALFCGAAYAEGTVPAPCAAYDAIRCVSPSRANQAPANIRNPSAAAPVAQVPTPPGPTPAELAQRAAAAAKANVDVIDAWTRATPGNATTAAVYLTISNIGKEPDRLIGADVGASQKAELHTMSSANGVMRMDTVPAMAIPASGMVTFSPAGNHIMLIGLKAPLKEGESFLIKLNFEKAGTETAAVKVLAANALGPPAPPKGGNPRDVTSGVTPAR